MLNNDHMLPGVISSGCHATWQTPAQPLVIGYQLQSFFPPPSPDPPHSSVMAPKPFKLEDYKPILVAHEREFRNTKGTDRADVVADIMQEIIALHQEGLDDSTSNGLGKASDWH